MVQNLYWLVFIVSVALSAGSIVLSSRLRTRYKSDIFSNLLYFQVFINTFGFYGIWGQVGIKNFLMSYISPDVTGKISDFGILLGLPFLIFAWLMLIMFSARISGRKTNNLSIGIFLIVNFSVLTGLGYILTKSTNENDYIIESYYILMNLLYTILASFFIYFPRGEKYLILDNDRKILAPALLIIMAVHCTLIMFINSGPYTGLLFIFAFFAGNSFLPVYLNYGTIIPPDTSTEPMIDISFNDFCRKYEVSPRETEIILQICNGLSNKEISEKLFISLQTVKDHTHRIYTKTNVKNRVQLINLVKDLKKG